MFIPTLTPSTYERIATTISQYGKTRLIDTNAWERALNGSRTYLLRHNTYLRQPRRLTSLWYGFLKATILFRHFSLDSQAYWSSVTARRPLWELRKSAHLLLTLGTLEPELHEPTPWFSWTSWHVIQLQGNGFMKSKALLLSQLLWCGHSFVQH